MLLCAKGQAGLEEPVSSAENCQNYQQLARAGLRAAKEVSPMAMEKSMLGPACVPCAGHSLGLGCRQGRHARL